MLEIKQEYEYHGGVTMAEAMATLSDDGASIWYAPDKGCGFYVIDDDMTLKEIRKELRTAMFIAVWIPR